MPDKPLTAKRFRLVRKHLKLSQPDMATVCEVSQAHISYIENGLRDIPSNILSALYRKKNINPLYLLGESVPIEYQKEPGQKQLLTIMLNMQADIEAMKAEMTILYKERDTRLKIVK